MSHFVKRDGFRIQAFLGGVGIFLSRVSGLLREMIFATFLGAGSLTDAFFVAYRIPFTFRNLIAEGGITAVIAPILARLDLSRGKEFLSAFLSFFLLALFFLAGLGMVFSDFFVTLFASGLPAGSREMAISFTRWLFLLVVFFGYCGVAMAVLQVENRHFFAQFASVWVNGGLILGALLFYFFGRKGTGLWTYGLIIGALTGGILQTLWLIFFSKNYRSAFIRLDFHTGREGLKEAGTFVFPTLLGFGIYKISIILSTQFASYLPVGGVSHLNYGDRICQLPLALFGTALGFALLPRFSLLRDTPDHLLKTYKESQGFLLFYVLPVVGFLIVFASDLVLLLYGRGSFPVKEVFRTEGAIFGYSLGTIFASLQRIQLAFSYAHLDRKTPLMGGVSGLIFQGFVTYYLLPLDTLGVALGSSTGIFVQWLSLGILLRRKVPQLSLFPSHLGKTVFLFLVSTLFMVVFREIFSLPLFVRILLGGISGAGVYLLLGYLLRHPEVTLLWKRVFPFLR